MTPSIAPLLLRTIRHGLTPLVVIAVEGGLIPESTKSETLEFFAVTIAFAITMLWSVINERRAEDRALRNGQQAGAVGADRAGNAGGHQGP